MKKPLRENFSDSDKIYVMVATPKDYYDKWGNPVNAEKYDSRMEEIDKALFEAGANVKWDVFSDPESGWEGDDYQDTGFREMTVGQLRAAVDNAGIDESEIKVYSGDMEIYRDRWDEYMDKHPEIDPWDYTADYDIYEDYRIYDVYSMLFDSDDYVEGLVESKKGSKTLKEAEGESIEDIVTGYASWSGSDMLPAIRNCAKELNAHGYTAEEVKDFFDADGYWTEEVDKYDNLQNGVWDPEFASGIIEILNR